MVQVAYQSEENEKSTYASRRPEITNVFSIVQNNWLKFLELAIKNEKTPDKHVVREFEEFLGCGVLAKGFIRLKCDDCKKDKLLPFSCKRRGFCPSCCGRRMNEGSAFLSDHVFPHVPIRQWVLSFPIPVRFWMARNPRLITQALEIFHRILSSHYKKAANKLGVTGELSTGTVTVVQRFGGALNLNIHFHVLYLDGVYVTKKDGTGNVSIEFIDTLRPTNEDILNVIQKTQKRMLRALQRRGLVKSIEAESGGTSSENEDSIEAQCQGASVQYRLATGESQGRPVRRIGSVGFIGEDPKPTGELSSIVGGYSIHANVYVPKNDRAALERLCRYLLRPPVAEERLHIQGDKIIYKLKSKWSDGTQAIMLSGVEFIEKMVAIIPRPRIHFTRFHGILAPHATLRELAVPSQIEDGLEPNKLNEPINKNKCSKHRLRWADLLKRVFNVDLSKCQECGGNLKVIATIIDPSVITQILDHLGLPSAVPEFAPP